MYRWLFVALLIGGALLLILEYDIVGLIVIILGLAGAVYYYITGGFLDENSKEQVEDVPEEVFIT